MPAATQTETSEKRAAEWDAFCGSIELTREGRRALPDTTRGAPELERRIGLAQGQIQEALGLISQAMDRPGGNALLWARRALSLALKELDGEPR